MGLTACYNRPTLEVTVRYDKMASHPQGKRARRNTLPDNLCRWDGRFRGYYEVWYFTMNHQALGWGFWFRYTIEAPLAPAALPHSELWAFAFDPKQPGRHIALKQTYSMEKFDQGAGQPHIVRIGDHAFGADFLSGSVANAQHRIGWDLRFEPSPTTYQHVPAFLRACVPLKTRVCSPNLDARFRGTVQVDDRTIVFENEPGCQSHIWGRKHAEAWLWLHCNAFGSDTVIEALAARPKVLGWTIPLTSSIYVQSQGQRYRFNSFQVRNEPGPGQWRFEAINAQARLRGHASCAPEKFVQVTYHDPDGELSYCCNSEIANCRLELEPRGARRAHAPAEFTAHGTAHFEIAARTPNPAVPLYI